jgi:outer membrane protein
MLKYLPVVNLILVLSIGVYVIFFFEPEKKAYVINQRVFDEFKGKQELEAKLVQLKGTHKTILDSMMTVIQRKPDSRELMTQYQQTMRTFEEQQQELSTSYTADIWKRINQYVSEYGKTAGYDFIFGATGDGGLMYANDVNDITDEVIDHINRKYEASE